MTPPGGPSGANPGGPTMPSPTIPTMPNFGANGSPLGQPTSFTCSKCNKDVSAAAKSCPHCGAFFEYTENPDGSKSYHSGGSSISGRGIAGLVKIGIFVVLAIIGGGAALIRKLTSG